MFENILICSFVLKNNLHLINTTFELAKKFDSHVILLKCLHEANPVFGLFKTKSEKKKHSELTDEIQLALKEVEEMAKHSHVSLTTESVFADSLSEYVHTYVHTNNIDLLIADSTPPIDIDIQDHKDIVNRIYKNVECSVLTLK